MFRSFKEMEEAVLGRGLKKRIALAGAHDEDALSAVVFAKRKQLVEAVLIGNVEIIKNLLRDMNEPEEDYDFIECYEETEAANIAFTMVKNKEADVPMKGLMQTSSFMRAILNKEKYGFVKDGDLLSQATVLETEGRLMIITDCAVNIAPSYTEKVKIVKNALSLAKRLEIEKPNVAVITPVEVVNPNIQSTIDAAMLSKAGDRGQIKNCIIDGPLALDNALSEEACKHKGIESPVAGKADILLVPDLCTGNVLTKALVHFADIQSGGILLGTSVPVVMTSRSDKPENKFFAILSAVL
ncbi:MAG: hypothetical protein CVU99_10545 [Firmicutes bacterium HGW-Firmicutes-4]|jgi:phosphate butyryltransferase|nr:MAG: hypothetical protein CVU99_10545 [Firmicutes bacterium HGW-Firmicutes-4]